MHTKFYTPLLSTHNFGLLALLLFCVPFAHAQTTRSLSGQFVDKSDNSALIGLNILLINQADTARMAGAVTDLEGNFRFQNLATGTYQLRASYIGYKSVIRPVQIGETDVNLGVMPMEQDVTALSEVEIQGMQIRAEQRGDTTEYNARAYKVNPDADASELVRKMPGITLEGGTVRAQGEDVRRVTVDGQEFFGEDAQLALRNLPAEVIDKIQVLDRLSDQARLTGFNDGNTEKTINIVTRPGMNQGVFGRGYAGYGTDSRYNAGGNINFFNGPRRISIIGMSNNINLQNFSTQDLAGVASGSGGRGGGGRGGRGGGGGGRGPGGGGGSDPSNFLVGQQGGISTTNSIGLNYSEKWGQTLTISGSYFFNNTGNVNNGQILSETWLPRQQNQPAETRESQFYDENGQSFSSNQNHRVNLRIEYNIDSANSIILTPRIALQNNGSTVLQEVLTSLSNPEGLRLQRFTQTDVKSSTQALNLNNDLLYRHKFKKDRRTLSVNLGTQYNNRDGRNFLYSFNEFYAPDSVSIIDQLTTTASQGLTLSTNVSYTEPLGKTGMLQFNYSPSVNYNNSERITNQAEPGSGEYTQLDLLLSNRFDNRLTTQRGGLSYRMRSEKINFMAGLNYQHVLLSSEQTFPVVYPVERPFTNLLPMAMFQYTFNKNTNVRMFYRTNTNAPSINQLQNVINNTNPLLLTAGNPNLKQEFTHRYITRFNLTAPDKGRTFFAFFNVNYTDNYIGNSTLVAATDTLLADGILLQSGSRLNRPENMSAAWSTQSFITYGLPVQRLKSNLNLNGGVSYNRNPGLINGIQNISNNYNLNAGFVLGSNISEKLDFTLSYSTNYNIVENTLQQTFNNFYLQNSSARLNWLPWKGLVFNTDLNHNLYTGLGEGFNQSIWLWNAGIGYKFLKNRAGELRLSAFDILGQNVSVNRTVGDTFIEDTRTQVLSRYFMLTFTYNLRHFKGAARGAQPNIPQQDAPRQGGERRGRQ
jgi:hypothetical protein